MRKRSFLLPGLAAIFIVTSGAVSARDLQAGSSFSFQEQKQSHAEEAVTTAFLIQRSPKGTSNRNASAGGGLAPMAYQLFCLRHPEQCQAGQTASIRMTEAVMGQLQSVNRAVNRSIRPVNDKRRDVWAINVRYGDCEDYALTKRARLMEMGFPAGALRMAVARTSSGEGHAVLIVRASDGDHVLDNRTNTIRKWHQTDLRMISVATANPLRWSSRLR